MAKFEIFTAKNGKVHFNLKASNGEVILSSQGYASRATCLKGIASVRKNATLKGRFLNLTAKNGKPYFNLIAANKLVIGKSEMYESAKACANGIASVMKNAPKAEIAK